MNANQNEEKQNSRTPWPFRERWTIRGCLVTESPLFIGSGETTTHDDLKDGDKAVEIADCARGADERPIIPATSLKGVLRSWLELHVDPRENCIGRVFGLDASKADTGCGGEAGFHDASLTLQRSGETPLPHWDEKRQTWVEIINSIDRERGAAAENHLAHRATVPAGAGFAVEISGRFTAAKADIPLLLAALEGFNDPDDAVTLGADSESGKGRMRWELESISCMDAAAAAAWMEIEKRGMARDALVRITPELCAELLQKAAQIPLHNRHSRTRIAITLEFDGPFLVNDPPTEREKDVPQNQKPADARPRTDEQGRVILPAKSFRGVLRSQAEKILRTMLDLDEQEWLNPENKKSIEQKKIACRPEMPDRACAPLSEAKYATTALCLACQLFGAPGWRTPLRISDFRLKEGHYKLSTQEMLAVDRFTGGGKDGAKYNAYAIIDPVLEGTVELDEKRLADMPWAKGLLALVLRDLKEGDLAFGWGAAGKGYGRVNQAVIPLWSDRTFIENATASWNALRDELEARRPSSQQTDQPHSDTASEEG